MVVAVIAGSSVLFLGGAPRSRPAAADAPDPIVIVDPATTQLGQTVVVELQSWPPGPVTVSLCGNTALRGSEDCDPVGAETVPIGPSGHEGLRLTITTPPVGCPCVVRANTTASDVVRSAPIEVLGLASDVHLPPAGPADTRQLLVTAQIRSPSSWLAPFAGPTPRALVLTLHNITDQQLTGLRLVGEVGRHRGSGQPIASPLPPLAARSTRRVVVPFHIGAPAFGRYVVSGDIYGPAVPVTYTVKTATEPWALELLLPILLLVIAQVLRYRDRKERRAAEAAAQTALVAPAPFRESSPGVGYPVDGHWRPDLYDPARAASVGVRAHAN